MTARTIAAVISAWALASLFLPIVAVAQPAPSLASPPNDPNLVTAPVWLRRPSGNDLARVYPPRAAEEGIGGRATLICGVDGDGRLEACKIESESPVGYGFGEAILKLAPLFRMGPLDRAGGPTAGKTVRVPMVLFVPGKG